MADNYGVDPTIFMQRYEQSQARRVGSVRGWKLPQGTPGVAKRSVIRMMPGHENVPGRDPIVETKIHFNLGPQRNTAAPCLEFYGKPCPACLWVDDVFGRARRAGSADEAQKLKDFAYDMRAKWRFGCQIVDMAQPNNGVQEFWFPDELEKKLRACFLDDNMPPQYRDICHPQTGRNIILEVSTKPNTEWPSYDVVRAAESVSALPDLDWLKDIKDMIFEHAYEPSPEAISGALQGVRIQRPGQQGRVGAIKAAPAQGQLAAAPQATLLTPGGEVVQQQQAAPPVPASRSRSGGRQPAQTTTLIPGAPVEQAAAPAAAVTPPPPGKTKRTPVGAAPSGNGWAGAYAAGKAEVMKIFQSPKEITEKEVNESQKPPCYMTETDPTDPGCQSCSLIIPCMAHKMGFMKV